MDTRPTVEVWPHLPPVDATAPDPAVLADGPTVWVAYRTADGPFAVVRFDGVEGHRLGPPDAEHLKDHPFYGRGLRAFAFHEVMEALPDAYAPRRWIATFHDETLEVTASGAMIVARGASAASAREALRALMPGDD